MLDDLKYIHDRDAQDALGVAEKQWQQLLYGYELPEKKASRPGQVVYAGMGGSALAASLSRTWPGYDVPFEVCRGYQLPRSVNAGTLVIVASYSGNTEEALSALADAEARQAQIAVIAGGGKLQEQAVAKGYPLLVLPKAEQPRFAALYNLKAIVTLLVHYQLVDARQTDTELTRAAEFLKGAVQAWLPAVPASSNPAKQLALELVGKTR